MTLEIHILGPIEAVRDGARLDLHGARQRRLLGTLALTAGQVRSIDAVLDSVWPDGELPGDPRQAVHTCASRLRSVLGPDTVLARDGGYQLAVGADDVDEVRFERLVRRAAEPACGLDRRVALLDEALRLWRGAAFDGFASEDWCRADAVRLEELRAAAIDEKAEALLQLGRAADAVPELEAAAVHSPLRERTHALLMLALQQSGRQAEALRVFQRFRKRLGTDLGLEPSEELCALESRLLAGDLPPRPQAEPVTLRGYELGERIGDGAYSVVYRSVQPAIGREVAVKVIRSELADRPEFIRRFETEAHLVARLEHPFVVPLYDYWREPGSAVLVMRLLKGGTLEDRIPEHRLTGAEAATMLEQVGAALGAAHRAGVVHRDIKSANIFLDGEGNFFLGDFGIAWEAAGPHDSLDALSVGSPAYAAPEQLRREAVDAAADVHGLGIVLFEALAGHLPFHGARTQAALLQRQLHDPVPSLRASRPDLPVEVDTVIARATAKAPADRYASVAELVRAFHAVMAEAGLLQPGRRAEPVADESAPTGRRNPYKGLRAFQEADAADFHGRRRMVARLLERLSGTSPERRVVCVVGPSGSGKSSLVRAGLLPAVHSGRLVGCDRWYVTSMVPGAHPFEELESALVRVAAAPVTGWSDLMAADARGISRAVKSALPSEDGELLLLVDQFEELFTLCPDESVRQRFVAGLVGAVSDPRSRVRVVLTLRADFYDRPLRLPDLATLMESSSVPVTPLAADELERAIVEPASSVGVSFEPGLVARIVADVVDQPGALPLLQYALTELFDRHDDGVMTIASYDELGGLSGALGRRAEAIFAELTEGAQCAARRLFTRLVTLGEGTEDTRRRARRSELGDAAETETVMERFGGARLLSFDHDPTTREPTVEVAHEALLREWRRLRGWLDDDRDGLRLHRHLTATASAWVQAGRDPGELYRGGRLEATEHWASAHTGELNRVEQDFLDASVDERRRQRAAEERARQRLHWAFVAVAAVAVLALVAGGIAWQRQRVASAAERRALADREKATTAAADLEVAANEADRQRDAANAAYAAAETQRIAAIAPDLVDTNLPAALLLAAEAANRDPNPTSLGALHDVLVGADDRLGFLASDERIRAVRIDESGTRAYGFGDTAIHVWEVTTHEELERIALPVPPIEFDVREFAESTPVLAEGWAGWMTADRRIEVLDLATGAATDLGPGADVAFDPGGNRVAVSNQLGRIDVYALPGFEVEWSYGGDGFSITADLLEASGLEQHPLADRPLVSDVAFSADGATLYQGRDAILRSFDAGTGEEIAVAVPAGPNDTGRGDILGNNIAPWPDGSGRFTAGGGVFAVAMGGPELDVQAPSYTVQPFSMSDFIVQYVPLADRRLAALRQSGQLVVVDALTGELIGSPIDAQVGQSLTVGADAGGHVLAVGGEEGMALLALDGSGLIRTAVPTEEGQYWAAGGSDASWLAIESQPFFFTPEARRPGRMFSCPAAGDCTSRVEPRLTWSTFSQSDNVRPDLLTIYHPPGERASATLDVVEVSTGATIAESIDMGAMGQVAQAVDPEGRWIVSSTMNPYSTRVDDLATGVLIRSFRDTGPMQYAVPPDGSYILAFGNPTGIVTRIDTATRERAPAGIPDGEARLGTFSADGRWLLTVGAGGSVALRDGDTLEIVHQLLADGGVDNSDAYQTVGFSDDGRYVATAHDRTIRLWDTATGEAIGRPVGSALGSAPIALPGDAPVGVAFTDEWVEVWRLDPDTWLGIACRAAGRNLTQAEWDQHGPGDTPYHATCPHWPSGA